MLPTAIALIFLALILLHMSSRQRRATGLPKGRVIYADTNRWGPVEKPLYDPSLKLTGKPDYLVKHKDKVIPVEVKSKRISKAPYDSHILQLIAYCFLVMRAYNKRPPYGILHYRNRTFAIDFTPKVESTLVDLINEMRELEHSGKVNRSHNSPARCHKCGFRSICDQNLLD